MMGSEKPAPWNERGTGQIRQGEVLCYIGVRDARGEGGGRHRGDGQ